MGWSHQLVQFPRLVCQMDLKNEQKEHTLLHLFVVICCVYFVVCLLFSVQREGDKDAHTTLIYPDFLVTKMLKQTTRKANISDNLVNPWVPNMFPYVEAIYIYILFICILIVSYSIPYILDTLASLCIRIPCIDSYVSQTCLLRLVVRSFVIGDLFVLTLEVVVIW